MVAFLLVGLAGCASDLTSRPNRLAADAAPDEGVFTGEFVEGKPVYRFPTIVVVGSRSSVWRAPDPEGMSHDN
jgi:hypothetical protein